MRPPAKVKLGGQEWSVQVVKLDPDLTLYGRTQTRSACIQIDTQQAPTQMRDTVLHELLHAIWSNVPLGFSDDDEERIIRTLTPWLLAALRDNPRLAAFLLAKE